MKLLPPSLLLVSTIWSNKVFFPPNSPSVQLVTGPYWRPLVMFSCVHSIKTICNFKDLIRLAHNFSRENKIVRLALADIFVIHLLSTLSVPQYPSEAKVLLNKNNQILMKANMFYYWVGNWSIAKCLCKLKITSSAGCFYKFQTFIA